MRCRSVEKLCEMINCNISQEMSFQHQATVIYFTISEVSVLFFLPAAATFTTCTFTRRLRTPLYLHLQFET